jgi:hypothetical protein
MSESLCLSNPYGTSLSASAVVALSVCVWIGSKRSFLVTADFLRWQLLDAKMNQMLKGQCALQIGQSSCYFAMQIWLRGRLDEWNGWERKWIVPKQMRSQDQNLYTAQMENDAAMTCYCIPKTCNETVFFTGLCFVAAS